MQDSSDRLIAPSNAQDIADLKDKLQDLEQINLVLGSSNLIEYTKKRRLFEAWLLTRNYTQAHCAKLDELFDNFKFEDRRRQNMVNTIFLEFQEAYGHDPLMQAYFTETDPPARLWQLLCLSFQSIHDKKNQLKENVCSLIHLQRDRLQQQLTQANATNHTVRIPPPSITNTPSNPPPPTPPHAHPIITVQPTDIIPNPLIAQSRYPDLTTLALLVAGNGLIGLSFLQILSPKFALLLGVHFSPVMLVFLSFAGAALAAYGLNRHLTQTTDNATQAATAPVNQPKRFWEFCFKFGGTANNTQAQEKKPALPNFF